MNKLTFKLPKELPAGSMVEFTVEAKLKPVAPGLTTAELVEQLGVSRATIHNRAKALDLHPVNELGTTAQRGRGGRKREAMVYWTAEQVKAISEFKR